MADFKDKCVKFVEHIQAHSEVREAPKNAGIVVCKVCNKTINEIYEEEDNWNLADKEINSADRYSSRGFKKEDFKTFIQKVKEDISAKRGPNLDIEKNEVFEIIDSRAGKL